MDWKDLTSIDELSEIIRLSHHRPSLIFKHSTRCSISVMVKNRLDKESNREEVDFYYLDLLRHRDVSNQIAQQFNVAHESPQALLIYRGECIYDESHLGIQMQEILEQLP